MKNQFFFTLFSATLFISFLTSCDQTYHAYSPVFGTDGYALQQQENVSDTTGNKFNTEEYNRIYENPFVSPHNEPLSTFSVDVDKASYANVRRFLTSGMMPPPDAVRIEEMVNYFDYSYPQPQNGEPFSVSIEKGTCPWNERHQLVMIGLKGKEIDVAQSPQNNLVFLIDVSGSMDEENKLPLVKTSLQYMLTQLRGNDKVAIVVYAGNAGLVLPSTYCDQKDKISEAISGLEAGGSTAGGEGINLAYSIAEQNFMPNGNNRVILATDGDFNVGVSSDGDLERLIEEKRKSEISLTVLGFGMGNYKDSKMETLADAGNGNYFYIDSYNEARKALGKELWGTLFTIAKDVKLQVEFNPAYIKGYRLIGYENRMLKAEDFNNDKKDAGDIGSGHTVTAFYEIIPAAADEDLSADVDPLRYQDIKSVESNEMFTLKLRYKEPVSETSKLIEMHASPGIDKKISDDFLFASSVAEFGLLLRNSAFKGTANYEQLLASLKSLNSISSDAYKKEMKELVEEAQKMANK